MDETSEEVVIPLVKDIIDRGFNQAELSVDEKQVVGQLKRLGKRRLIEIHNQLVSENTEITKWNELLNKNTYKYFVRKKSSQSLIKDNPELVARLEKQYKTRLAELGEVISKHEKVRVGLTSQLKYLVSNRNKLCAIQEETVKAFEDLTEETGKPLKSLSSGQKLSPEALENVMAQIRTTRQQVSEARLHFIKTLDRHTQMEVRAAELQDLGNGLRMNDFSQLREERQCLEEKIEERNNTLEKLRLRCFSDTQILSHVREKKYMLEGTDEDEQSELQAVIREMKVTRNFMNSCNAKCEKLRKSYAEISTNCGLLDKPDLLRDFDETEWLFKQKMENIEKIRRELEDIKEKTDDLVRIMSDAANVNKSTSADQMRKENQILNTTKKTICISPSVLEINQC